MAGSLPNPLVESGVVVQERGPEDRLVRTGPIAGPRHPMPIPDGLVKAPSWAEPEG